MNRETRRAAARAGLQMPPAMEPPRPAGPDLVIPAMLAAATGECRCKPCRLLRRAAAAISDLAEEEEDGADGG